MKRGKAQYSFEFLVTYGWALLILGIIMGAIYTFGWIDPANFLPQKCSFYGQTGCRDFYVSETELNLSLINNFGVQLYIDQIALLIEGDVVCNNSNLILPWNRSDPAIVSLDLTDPLCDTATIQDTLIPGRRADIIARVTYFSNLTCPGCGGGPGVCSDCSHFATGKILAKVSR
jgi:hypothetical protein